MDGQLETSVNATTTTITWLVPAIGLGMILTVLIWLRRRLRDNKSRRTSPVVMAESSPSSGKPGTMMGEMPVCLTKNVLDQERFTTNPEYDWNADRTDQGSTSSDTAQLLHPGDQFKPFVIIRPEWIELKQEIGEGCFGKVFRGSLHRPADPVCQCDDEAVAVKVLKAAAGPAAQDELLQEAEIMASFSHPNILSLKGIVINGSVY